MSENDSNIPPDPIYAKSLSLPIFIAGLAVLGAVVFAIVDDVWLRRPYIAIQSEWKSLYLDHLRDVREVREVEVNEQLRQLERFQELEAAVARAAEESQAEIAAVQRDIFNLDAELKAVLDAITSPRSEIAALGYEAEHAAAAAGFVRVPDCPESQPYLEEIEEIRAQKATYSWVERAEGDVEPTVAREEEKETGWLIERMLDVQNEKAARQRDVAAAAAPLTEATAARDRWLSQNLANLKQILDNAADDQLERVAAKVSEVGIEAYIDQHVTSLKPEQLDGIIDFVESFNTGIRIDPATIQQIHIPETANWVDRCETCHLNARAELPVPAEAMGGKMLFASHPRRDELFANHDPQRFGCSMCHGGNGVAITSTEDAHGLNKHWLQRLYPEENYEAGCVQCHVEDAYLEGGERINQAKDDFRHFGCWGCHKMKGYDDETERARDVAKRLQDIEGQVVAKATRIDSLGAALNAVYDQDEDRFNELSPEKERLQAALKMEIAGLRTEGQALRRKLSDLYKERKKVGPNLKDVRAKVRPEWLTPWVADPKAWRPGTKMPAFRWADDEEPKDVAAFLWQSATPAASDKSAYGVADTGTGDATRGERIFKTVGCLACHGIEEGEGENRTLVGNTFAANLSKLGDKYNRDTGLAFYVHWIENPRHRLAPYCDTCERDLSPEDFEKAGKELVFSRRNTTCPNCGSELQWDNPTVMPSLRLSRQEAVDVGTYLIGRASDAAFPAAPWLTDTTRFERGRKLVMNFGCAGCHEIAGLEREQRIGTELSDWGAKPMERLDFGHFTREAKKGNFPIPDWTSEKDEEAGTPRRIFDDAKDDYLGKWYNHRGFALHKLAQPDIYDTSKNVFNAGDEAQRFARLRMPKFNLSGQEIFDLSTFLIGTVGAEGVPESIKYKPDTDGMAIREGWRLVKKYNCEGCHQVRPGETPVFKDVLAHVTPSDAASYEKLPPPYLVGTGFRTRPVWLAGFLDDPSLGGGRERPKAVRPFVAVRMPTFSFTENEIGKFVRFFDAMSKQQLIYKAPTLAPLGPTEKTVAETIFNDQGSCLQCHVVDGKEFTTETKAPNLSLAGRRLKPEWMQRWIRRPTAMEPGTAMSDFFKKECPHCKAQFDNGALDAQHRAVGSRDVCANCGENLAEGRWVYLKADQLPAVKAFGGDHIDLMIRYLLTLSK